VPAADIRNCLQLLDLRPVRSLLGSAIDEQRRGAWRMSGQTAVEAGETRIPLRTRVVPSFDFGDDLLQCGPFEPAVTVARVVSGARPIEAEKSHKAI